jgi:hypothetical protein
MQLSSETLAVLKNFASINSNIVFRGGSTIKTMSEAKNILASANVSDQFPDREFGIYDLNEFLGVVSMFDNPELDIDNNFARISQDRRAVQYFFSDPSILTSPSKDIQMPEPEVKFALGESDLNTIRRAASTLSVSDLVIEYSGEGNELKATVTDLADSTSNSFSLDLEPITLPTGTPFRFVFSVSNFKILSGDYTVDVSSKLISHLVSESNAVQYWIALEKSSTYGEN